MALHRDLVHIFPSFIFLFYYPIDPHTPLLPPSFNILPPPPSPLSHGYSLLSSLIFSSIVVFSVIVRCLFLFSLFFSPIHTISDLYFSCLVC